MSQEPQNDARLQVLEARKIERGTVWLDSLIGSTVFRSGDIIEIIGKRRTIARCQPLLHDSDLHKGIVRIDRVIRENAGVTVGDMVIVKKVDAPPAEKVGLAPLKAIPSRPYQVHDERYLADALNGVPVTKSDKIVIRYRGGGIMFQVVDVNPVPDVVITPSTTFEIAGHQPNEHLKEELGSEVWYCPECIMTLWSASKAAVHERRSGHVVRFKHE